MTTPAFLILREDAAPQADGRTLICRIATYGRVYRPNPTLRERVLRGAFRGPLARPNGVLRYRHAGERPGDSDDLGLVHGIVRGLHEDGDHVLADVDVFPGPDGDKILALVGSGAVTGVSMAAVVADRAMAADWVVDIRRITQLNGLSLTPSPGYDNAGVLALREQPRVSPARLAQERAYWATVQLPGVSPRR